MKYSLMLTRFYSSLWALLPEFHSTLEHILLERVAGEKPDHDEIAARRLKAESYSAARPSMRKSATTIIIPLYGPIIDRPNMFSEISGAASHQQFAHTIRQVADDPDVERIIVDLDSPGGLVSGVDVSAEAMRYAANRKEVIAVTEGYMTSAGYWIGSQAPRIVAGPTAVVGSIGILATHKDVSKAEEMLGIKTTILRTGKDKALGSPDEPLSKHAYEKLLEQLKAAFSVFLADVAKGRGMTPDEVRKRYGDGGVYTGQEALNVSLIDEIGTLQSVLDGLSAPKRNNRKAQLERKSMDLDKLTTTLGLSPGATEGDVLRAIADMQSCTTADQVLTADTSGLEKEITRLTAQLEEEKREKVKEKRVILAISAINDAKLPDFPKVEGMDLAASFRARIEALALNAKTDDEAREVMAGAIAEQKALMGGGKSEKPRAQQPSIPMGEAFGEDRKTDRRGGVSSIRAGLGL